MTDRGWPYDADPQNAIFYLLGIALIIGIALGLAIDEIAAFMFQ